MKRTTTLTVLLLVSLLAGVIYLTWQGSRQASVQVDWETASELDTAGFNLYRSLDPDGPFIQVNQALIPTAGDPLSGGEYHYEDTAVQPGREFYYQLEEVRLDGSSQRFGPISVETKGWVPSLGVPVVVVAALALFLALIWRSAHRKKNSDGDQQSTGIEQS